MYKVGTNINTMVNSVKKIGLFVFLLGLTLYTFAQRTPPIGFQVTYMDSFVVDFSWVTPAQATSCEIVYETYYDTTTHPISLFTLDSTRLPRANPVGPFERFTIKFTTILSNQLEDSVVMSHLDYGVIVLVEEDIFVSTVIGNCFNKPAGAESFYFVDACLVCDFDMACKISTAFLESQSIESDNPAEIIETIDPQAYKLFMIDSLKKALLAEVPGVKDCYGVVPPTSRRPALSPKRELFSISPNPFLSQILIQSRQATEELAYEMKVINLHGKLMTQPNYVIKGARETSLNTRDWPSGIYIMTLQYDGNREVHKLIKP